jgi:folylpolyglutamate synthase/dihydropteroate synthase
MLTSILKNAEYKVGRLQNSHIFDFRERITINDAPIEHLKLTQYTDKIAKQIKRAKKPESLSVLRNLSSKEIIIAIAMEYFLSSECDIIIIDCGKPENLGILNSLPKSAVNIITCIQDNYKDTGETEKNLKSILTNVRKGMYEIICNIKQSDDFNKLSLSCANLGCRITLPAQAELEVTKNTLKSLGFTYRGRQYQLSTPAHYSITNAITVIEAAYALRRVGMKIRSACIEKGLFNTYLSARLDIISIEPTIIADCATTPMQIIALCDSLKRKEHFFPKGSNIKLFCDGATKELFKQNSDILFADNYFILNENDFSPAEIDCGGFEQNLNQYIKTQSDEQIILCVGSSEYIGKAMFFINRILNEI